MTREERLVQISRSALRWLTNRIEGTGRNGMHDDLIIARELSDALSCYAEDVPMQRDLDRRNAAHRREQEAETR